MDHWQRMLVFPMTKLIAVLFLSQSARTRISDEMVWRALLLEGLVRLKKLGAADVTVLTGDLVPANRLYESVGYNEAFKGYTWRKVFKSVFCS
jgi:hypothetical protein